MPTLPPDEVVAGTPELIAIPPQIYQVMVQNGYTGSRYVYATEIDAIIQQFAGGGAGTPDPNAGPTVIVTGGSSGGGYSTGPTAGDLANLRASFLDVLRAWDMNVSKSMLNLVDQGVNKLWTTTNFMMHVRGTKEYKQAFAGIQRGMSEDEYIDTYEAFRDRAQDVGKPLTTQAFGVLLKKGVGYEEWDKRITAIDRIKGNEELFEQFGETLKQRGLLKGKFTMKDVYDFVRGKGSPIFEKVWEEAAFTAGIERAGFQVGEGADISRKALLKMIGNFESNTPGLQVEDLGDDFYKDLADRVRTLIPASRLAGFGLTNTDILELQVNGPRAGKIAESVNQILANVERLKTGPTAKTQAQSAQGGIVVAGLEEDRAQTL